MKRTQARHEPPLLASAAVRPTHRDQCREVRPTGISRPARTTGPVSRHLAVALAVISASQLMVVLDATIVTVALPSIRTALHFSPSTWSGRFPPTPLCSADSCRLGGRLGDVFGRRRMLAADDGYVRYIEQSGRSVLPLKPGETALITPSSLGRLADTPRQKAESHGPWRDLRTTLRWTSTIRGCSLFAWEVTLETRPSQTATDQHG